MELILQFFYWIFKELQFHFYFKPRFDRSLKKFYPHYQRLNSRQQKRFLRMTRDQYEYFEFVPRGVRLTSTMKLVISAGAAHVIYNLPEESLSYFTRILVYADDYPSKITGNMHRGEVNPGMRLIVFSWRAVTEGLAKEEGINLLLHEFGHALWLENKLMPDHKIFEREHVKRFEKLAHEEMEKLAADEEHFYRRYAFENIHEFFAVTVENFFERPKQFKQAMPHFYDVCVLLFQQDPVLYPR